MRCIIFTAFLSGGIPFTPRADDYIVCADGGYRHCAQMGIVPHAVIGDCDSLPKEKIPPALLIQSPRQKDDTDTLLCLRHAAQKGCNTCLILGGLGGRLDHTFANLQALSFARGLSINAEIRDAYDRAFLLENEEINIAREDGSALSLFSITETCEGVFAQGVRYPLQNATLTQCFPLGVSNEITAGSARVAVARGRLLVILSKLER